MITARDTFLKMSKALEEMIPKTYIDTIQQNIDRAAAEGKSSILENMDKLIGVKMDTKMARKLEAYISTFGYKVSLDQGCANLIISWS